VVEFSSYEDMKNAIRKLDDTELKGKRILLREAPVNIINTFLLLLLIYVDGNFIIKCRIMILTVNVIVSVVVARDLVLDLHAVALVDHLLVPLVELLVVHVRDPRLLPLIAVRNMVLVQSHLAVVMNLAAQKEVVPEVGNIFVMMTSKSVSYLLYSLLYCCL
jgi:hypothetical protein